MQEVCTVGQRVHVLGGLCLQMPTTHQVLNQLLLNGGKSHATTSYDITPPLICWDEKCFLVETPVHCLESIMSMFPTWVCVDVMA